jgi:hypothetical protein
VTLVVGATPVAFAAGTVITTVGDYATPRG